MITESSWYNDPLTPSIDIVLMCQNNCQWIGLIQWSPDTGHWYCSYVSEQWSVNRVDTMITWHWSLILLLYFRTMFSESGWYNDHLTLLIDMVVKCQNNGQWIRFIQWSPDTAHWYYYVSERWSVSQVETMVSLHCPLVHLSCSISEWCSVNQVDTMITWHWTLVLLSCVRWWLRPFAQAMPLCYLLQHHQMP